MTEKLDAREIARENVVGQMIDELLAAQETKNQLDGIVRRFLESCGVDVDTLRATVDDPTSCDDDFVIIIYAADCATVQISTASSDSNRDCLAVLQSVRFPEGILINNRGDSIYITIPSALLVDETLEERPGSCVQLGYEIARLRDYSLSRMEEMGRLVGAYLAVVGVGFGGERPFRDLELGRDGKSVVVYINEAQLRQLIAGSAVGSLEVLRIEKEGPCSVRILLSAIDKALGQTSTKEGTGAGGSAIISTGDTKMKVARVLAEDEPSERKPDGGDTSVWDYHGQPGSDFDN